MSDALKSTTPNSLLSIGRTCGCNSPTNKKLQPRLRYVANIQGLQQAEQRSLAASVFYAGLREGAKHASSGEIGHAGVGKLNPG